MDPTLYGSYSPLVVVKQYANNGEVILGGHPMPVPGPVSEINLARFQNKVTFGEYSQDSDPLLSSDILSSFLGGIGNLEIKEGVDDDTCWTSTLETRYPLMTTLLRRSVITTAPVAADDAYPLGDYPAASPSFYAAFDTHFSKWSANTQTWSYNPANDLPVLPVGKGIEWRNHFMIPLGNAGYAEYAGGTSMTINSAIHVIEFAYWDEFLFALTTEGQLRILDKAGVWEALDTSGRMELPTGHRPRHLVEFVNQGGAPTLHIVTNRSVWAFDRDNSRIYKTHLDYPPAPDQGLGACNWRGESMYVSVGTGIHSYNGSTIGAMGPDGRYGLPPGLRGAIVDLEPEYNQLIAVVRGDPGTSTPFPLQLQAENTSYGEQEMVFHEVPPVKSCLLRWNSQGWHKVWESPNALGTPTAARISEADGEHSLWWGYAGKMYKQKVPRGFANSKTGIQLGLDEFEQEGHIVTGWFDADMPAFDKLASHMELNIDDPFTDGTPTGIIALRYQIDYDPTWYDIGQGAEPGMHVFPFMNVPADDEPSEMFSIGQSYRRIRFDIGMTRDPNKLTYSPVMVSLLMRFMKIPMSSMSWSFQVDLSHVGGEDGGQRIVDFLNDLLTTQKLITFTHRRRTYRARVAQVNTSQSTGQQVEAGVDMRLVEVHLPAERLRAQSGTQQAT